MGIIKNGKKDNKSPKVSKAQKSEIKEEDPTLLGKKAKEEVDIENLIDANDGDSSDEELVVRTVNVPRKWYVDMEHSGYDINANKVIKPKEEDEIEKFMKRAED